MLRKRNDAEGNTVDREMARTRITSAWVIVLSILLWVATPSPGNRSIRFSIRGSFGGGVVCVGSEGENTWVTIVIDGCAAIMVACQEKVTITGFLRRQG